jgi:hypothetical protein
MRDPFPTEPASDHGLSLQLFSKPASAIVALLLAASASGWLKEAQDPEPDLLLDSRHAPARQR